MTGENFACTHTHKHLSKDSAINNIHRGMKVAQHFNTAPVLLHTI